MTTLTLIAIATLVAIIASFVEAAAQIITDILVGDDFSRFPSKGGKEGEEVETLPQTLTPTTTLQIGGDALESQVLGFAPGQLNPALLMGRIIEGTCREVVPTQQQLIPVGGGMKTQNTQNPFTVKAVIMKAAHAVAKTMPSTEGTYHQRLSKALKLVWAWAKAQPSHTVQAADVASIVKKVGAVTPSAPLKPLSVAAEDYAAFIKKVKELEGNGWYYSLDESLIQRDITAWPSLQRLKMDMLSGKYRIYRYRWPGTEKSYLAIVK